MVGWINLMVGKQARESTIIAPATLAPAAMSDRSGWGTSFLGGFSYSEFT